MASDQSLISVTSHQPLNVVPQYIVPKISASTRLKVVKKIERCTDVLQLNTNH